MGISGQDGGYSTARVTGGSDAEQHRAAQSALAASYLTRTGNGDLLPILGLAAGRTPGTCRHCGQPMPVSSAASSDQGYCGRRECLAVKRATRNRST